MMRKNKTLAVWLALLGGMLGLHRFYLRGLGDWVGWLHPIPAALGLWAWTVCCSTGRTTSSRGC